MYNFILKATKRNLLKKIPRMKLLGMVKYLNEIKDEIILRSIGINHSLLQK